MKTKKQESNKAMYVITLEFDYEGADILFISESKEESIRQAGEFYNSMPKPENENNASTWLILRKYKGVEIINGIPSAQMDIISNQGVAL